MVCTTSEMGSVTWPDAWLHRCAKTLLESNGLSGACGAKQATVCKDPV